MFWPFCSSSFLPLLCLLLFCHIILSLLFSFPPFFCSFLPFVPSLIVSLPPSACPPVFASFPLSPCAPRAPRAPLSPLSPLSLPPSPFISPCARLALQVRLGLDRARLQHPPLQTRPRIVCWHRRQLQLPGTAHPGRIVRVVSRFFFFLFFFFFFFSNPYIA
jgi:hypothetical protein